MDVDDKTQPSTIINYLIENLSISRKREREGEEETKNCEINYSVFDKDNEHMRKLLFLFFLLKMFNVI